MGSRLHLVPVPAAASLAALNQRIAAADIIDDGRVITGRPVTVAPAFAAEQPAMRPLPGGVPSTPTTIQQTYGTNGGRAEFIPMMVELFKDVKAIFKDNPVELFTKGTGGSEFGFHSRRTLEDAIQKIGEELHSEYTITYTPNNKEEGGFHEIAVEVPSRRDAKTQARPGYWVAMK